MSDDGGIQYFQSLGQQEEQMESKTKTGLDLLREPFPAHQISKLPKPTISNDEWKKLPKAPCKECGGYHATSNTIHLDYVGHAALTDRLLDCDPKWTWEPLSLGDDGYPVIDRNGGMWIKLTVCGVTRLGYGDSQGKTGGNAIKECIGDALRNAAMRFGAALELWHKGDLHLPDDNDGDATGKDQPKRQPNGPITPTTGAWEAMDEGQQKVLTDIAMNVVALLSEERAAEAVSYIKQQSLSQEETVALWTRFDSKQRRAMKEAGK